MMLRQAHSISWSVLEGTFCGSEALCVTEKVALGAVDWTSAVRLSRLPTTFILATNKEP